MMIFTDNQGILERNQNNAKIKKQSKYHVMVEELNIIMNFTCNIYLLSYPTCFADFLVHGLTLLSQAWLQPEKIN